MKSMAELGWNFDVAAAERARDEALDMLERKRAFYIDEAVKRAITIADNHGSVTSVEVVAALTRDGFTFDGTDLRWMGAVFRKGTGWERVGWEPTGSHGRPVARWRRK